MVIQKQEPFKLTPLEHMGKDYEVSVKSGLTYNGFGRYIVYFNPSDDRQWKACRGNGVDCTLKIGRYRIDVEIKYNDADYPIRMDWLGKSGISRFYKCPKPDLFNLRVILVNRPQNWVTAKDLASYFGVMVLGYDELLSLLNELVISTNNYSSSVNQYQSNDYLSNYRITNNLVNKSIDNTIMNDVTTCYQNNPIPLENGEVKSIINPITDLDINFISKNG